ncbi:hypothetical protein OXX80_007311 [Metschnikowia pulcherrima]
MSARDTSPSITSGRNSPRLELVERGPPRLSMFDPNFYENAHDRKAAIIAFLRCLDRRLAYENLETEDEKINFCVARLASDARRGANQKIESGRFTTIRQVCSWLRGEYGSRIAETMTINEELDAISHEQSLMRIMKEFEKIYNKHKTCESRAADSVFLDRFLSYVRNPILQSQLALCPTFEGALSFARLRLEIEARDREESLQISSLKALPRKLGQEGKLPNGPRRAERTSVLRGDILTHRIAPRGYHGPGSDCDASDDGDYD